MKKSKKEDILSTARELFWKHGFRRVSVEEICESARVSKMTFYRFFPNKLELAKSVFNIVINEGLLTFQQIMNENTTPEEKIQKMLLAKYEGTSNISKEFMLDFYASKELGLNEYLKDKTTEIWQIIVSDFREAQQKGVFRKDFNPDFFMAISYKLTDLLNDPDLTKFYPNPQDMIMEVAAILMYGVAPKR
jgi:AcrR family transcriptional regulator